MLPSLCKRQVGLSVATRPDFSGGWRGRLRSKVASGSGAGGCGAGGL